MSFCDLGKSFPVSCASPRDPCATEFHFEVTNLVEGECFGSDWFVLVLLSVFMMLISWVPRWIIFEPLANRLRQSYPHWKKSTAEKFSQSLAAGSIHIVMGILAWNVLKTKDWLWDVEQWNQTTVSAVTGDKAMIDVKFKLYYLLYAARYISDGISLCFEHARSDTFAYAIHHVVTVTLVILSADAGCHRIGGVIMFFFDWADPPMLIGKAFLYLSLEKDDVYQQIADACMAIFVVLFVSTRIFVFTWIVYVCLRDFESTSTSIVVLKTFLVVLVLLMTFWFALIVKAIYNQFFNNEGHIDDTRETPDLDRFKKKQV